MIGYHAAHKGLQRARGKASSHLCAACGQPATDWALTTAGVVLLDPQGRTYSTDPADYTALCRACHAGVDLGRDVCRRGHPLTGDNLVQSHPRKHCATCRREHDELVRRAARALGMTKREFIASHPSGQRQAAELVVSRDSRGVA